MTTILKKIDYHIAIWGLIGIASTLAVADCRAGLSTLIGALIGMCNWIAFRKLVGKITIAGAPVVLGLFLVLKFALLLGVISLLFLQTPIRPVPFTIGISSLFLGISSFLFINIVDWRTSTAGGEE